MSSYLPGAPGLVRLDRTHPRVVLCHWPSPRYFSCPLSTLLDPPLGARMENPPAETLSQLTTSNLVTPPLWSVTWGLVFYCSCVALQVFPCLSRLRSSPSLAGRAGSLSPSPPGLCLTCASGNPAPVVPAYRDRGLPGLGRLFASPPGSCGPNPLLLFATPHRCDKPRR